MPATTSKPPHHLLSCTSPITALPPRSAHCHALDACSTRGLRAGVPRGPAVCAYAPGIGRNVDARTDAGRLARAKPQARARMGNVHVKIILKRKSLISRSRTAGTTFEYVRTNDRTKHSCGTRLGRVLPRTPGPLAHALVVAVRSLGEICGHLHISRSVVRTLSPQSSLIVTLCHTEGLPRPRSHSRGIADASRTSSRLSAPILRVARGRALGAT